MLSKCAHPACFNQFRYLSQGRVFKVRMPWAARRPTESRIEYFWLCENCAQVFKVVLKHESVLVTPLYLQLTAGPSESHEPGENQKVA